MRAQRKAGASKTDIRKRHRLKHIISTAVLILSVLLCLYVTVNTLVTGYTSFFGFSLFRVVTGSMEPTIHVGAVLVCQATDIEDIGVGDVICFRSRESSHYGYIVTHRVVSVQKDSDGTILLESRGDANYSSDRYYVRSENLIGRVRWHTGDEGVFTKMLEFLSGKFGFLLFIAVPVLVIVGLILQEVGRNIRGEMNKALRQLSKERKEAALDELLPGYQTLTVRDYNEIYEMLKKEIRKELMNRAETIDHQKDSTK